MRADSRMFLLEWLRCGNGFVVMILVDEMEEVRM